MRPIKEQGKFLLIYSAVVVVVILLIVAKTRNLLSDSSGPLMSWTMALFIFAVMMTLAVIMIIAAVHHSRKSAAKATPAATSSAAPAAGTASPTPTTTPKKTKEKSNWPFGKVVGLVAGLVVAGFFLIGITSLVAEVVKYCYSQPSAPRSVETVTRHESVSLPSLTDVTIRTPASGKSRRLNVYRDHEIQIPKVSDPSKEWYTQTLNTTDVLLVRCVKNGVDVGLYRVTGIRDGNTPLPKDVDTYYMRCLNRNQTEVIWTEK